MYWELCTNGLGLDDPWLVLEMEENLFSGVAFITSRRKTDHSKAPLPKSQSKKAQESPLGGKSFCHCVGNHLEWTESDSCPTSIWRYQLDWQQKGKKVNHLKYLNLYRGSLSLAQTKFNDSLKRLFESDLLLRKLLTCTRHASQNNAKNLF